MGTDDAGNAVGLPDAEPIERRRSEDRDYARLEFLLGLLEQRVKHIEDERIADLEHILVDYPDGIQPYLRKFTGQVEGAFNEPDTSEWRGKTLLSTVRADAAFRVKFQTGLTMVVYTFRVVGFVVGGVVGGLAAALLLLNIIKTGRDAGLW